MQRYINHESVANSWPKILRMHVDKLYSIAPLVVSISATGQDLSIDQGSDRVRALINVWLGVAKTV